MATVLPTLTSLPDKSSLKTIPTHATTGNAVNSARPISQPVVVVRQMLNKKELQLQERRHVSRSKLPELSEWQTNQYQNTYKQTLCIKMLQHGFHQSFCEIFGLIKQQSDARISAGPDSNLWNQRPLTEEHEKLDTMKQLLTEAESALLMDNYYRVYQCHHELAQYFQSTGDKWLSDHFFRNCLNFSIKVKVSDGRIAAQGHRDVGLSLEETGKVLEAAHHYELCYALTKGKTEWMVEDGKTPMHSESCNNLMRIYTAVANQYKANGDSATCLTYLTHAYEKAKEGGDRQLYGDASYQLGMAYVNNGRPEIALMHLQSFLETCYAVKDSEGIGKACEAIAKAHDSQGHVEESIKYLQKFVSVSEESKDDKSLCDACNTLGIRFNCLGKYSQSFDYSSRAYNIARALNDTTRLRLSRVLTGISHAHEMLNSYTSHVNCPTSRTCIMRLLEWKDSRGDEFDKPVTPAQDSTVTANDVNQEHSTEADNLEDLPASESEQVERAKPKTSLEE